ncbi:SWI/SNF complex subunit SWI3D [Vitis vinifera]|uniref:SWI/SNF complex subunit SWI3D n=1 Tax=Vitis vinifera TaxID=29760 RepID=A0A438C112_VITVI|nr:SWI/SNF complex subunit SWI3D [Vitis vinifera]RVX12163.1 SWI/SNF complex subunit SWI3D [Vitis vinifera]
MEEKRREAGSLPPASSSAGTVTAKVTETEPKSEPPSSRRRAGGQKRKSNNLSASNSTPSKRLAREKALAPPLASIHNGPCTRARQSPNNVSSAAAATAAASGALQKLDQPEAAPGASSSGAGLTAEELNVKNEDWEALEAEMAAEFEAIRSRDANVHVVPSSSGESEYPKTLISVHLIMFVC